MENQEEESFERALADVEIVSSAYPDEITSECSQDKFPLYFTIHLNKESNATISLEILPGYPTESGIQVATYRSKPHEKQRMEATILAVRREAKLCQQNSVEGGFSCCSAAFDTWNSFKEAIEQCSDERTVQAEPENQAIYDWVSGPPMVEKKSTFQGHLCRVENESQVQEALHQLISSSSKLQRASHNMVRKGAHMSDFILQVQIMTSKHSHDTYFFTRIPTRISYLLVCSTPGG